MIEQAEVSLKKRDYSCEIISVVALVVLSALSRFWYIAIATGVAVAAWEMIRLLGLGIRSAVGARIPSKMIDD